MHTRLLIAILLALLGLLTGTALQAQEHEFLRPEEAFRVSGATEGPSALALSWQIADGYYLYRNKFRFRVDAPGFELGQPELPTGLTKKDEFFGDVQVYRGGLTVRIPIRHRPEAADSVPLVVTTQGCADAGLCYPPSTRTITIALAPAAAKPKSETTQPAAQPPDAAGKTLVGMEEAGQSRFPPLSLPGTRKAPGLDDIVPPDRAFRFRASSEDGRSLQAYWQIADGTFLYRDKIQLSIEANDGTRLGDYTLPPGEIEHGGIRPDGSIGDVAVLRHDFDLKIPLLRGSTSATRVSLSARYQGCADRGICYPPVTKRVSLDLPRIDKPTSGATLSGRTTAEARGTPTGTGAEPVAEQDRLAKRLASGGIWVAIASFFLLGLGLAFTPCVFPMIPILAGIIAGQGATITPRRAFLFSLVYVLSMAATYTAAGVLAALFGENLQAAFQNRWVLSAFALVFVALALSMFGFYNLQLPSSLQSRLAAVSNRQRGGNLIGVAIMGLLSALIVGPCVAPPLAAALIYIGQTGDAVLGGSALFALSLGMGAPLIAIGTSAGNLLPKAGAWMDTVKGVFGVLMLGLAIYLLERILPAAVSMALWGTLFIVASVYMGALKSLPGEATGWARLWQGLGLVLLVYGALMLVGAAAGGRDTLQPLRGVAFGAGGPAEAPQAAFRRINTVDDLDRALATAAARGQPVMLDFYADWCTYCIEFEKYVFSDPKVAAALRPFVLLQADVTDNDAADKALLARFGITAPPAILFFGPNGRERKNFRVVGFMPSEEFATHVRQATGI